MNNSPSITLVIEVLIFTTVHIKIDVCFDSTVGNAALKLPGMPV